MKKSKALGLLLLALAVSTIVGMVVANDAYWQIFNYATIIISVLGGMALLKK